MTLMPSSDLVAERATPSTSAGPATRPGLLRAFNEAGVLVGGRHPRRPPPRPLAAAASDDAVLLAAALAVRAPRLGHVCIDLATIRGTVSTDDDGPSTSRRCPGPTPTTGSSALSASPLVAVGEDGPDGRPLRLVGTCSTSTATGARSARWPPTCRPESEPAPTRGRPRTCWPRAGPAVRPAPEPDCSGLAAAAAVLRRFTVVAGGPGTGKTTTVARILALLDEQAGARRARRRRWWRWPRRPARPRPGSRRRCTPRRPALDVERGDPGAAAWPRAPRPCTACSAGGPTAAAGSATTGATGCPTTS